MVKVGIIGMGIRGQLFARALLQNPHAEVVAFCEPNAKRALEVEKAFGVKTYSDLERFLDTGGMEAVVISTPDHAHYSPFMGAASRGLHVMIEKPLAVDVKEAEEMTEAAERSNKIFMVAFENRWNPPFIAARSAVDTGDIGEVKLQTIELNDTIYVPTRMLSWASRSSPAWFLLPHCVDLARWLSGCEIASVYATGVRGVLDSMGIGTYDAIQAIITFSGGGTASLSSSWILPESMPMVYDFKYEIIGSKGSLFLDFQDQILKAAQQKWATKGVLDFSVNNKVFAPPVYMVESFVDCIQAGKPSPCPIRDGLVVTQVIDAMYQSIASGQPIQLK